MIRPRLISYAQNREDIILDAFFDEDEVGFYVDVGAEDPTKLSVTKNFYDKGWNGINIEPITRQYELFLDTRPRDLNLNIGVSDKAGTLQLREYEGSGYSTFSTDMKQEHVQDSESSVKKYKDYSVIVQPLKQIFSDAGVTSIQFLKVDVEGLEYEVLAGNDWQTHRPEVICIEANHIVHDWRKLLVKNDYSLVFFDGLNEYYVDNKTKRAAKFDYIQSIVFKEPIVHYALLDDFEQYDKTITWLEAKNQESADKAHAEQAALQSQIQHLQQALDDVTPFRRHAVKRVKHQLRKVDRSITTKLSSHTTYVPQTVSYSEKSLRELLAIAHQVDTSDLAAYQHSYKPNPLLTVYSQTKSHAHRTIRKVLKKVIKN